RIARSGKKLLRFLHRHVDDLCFRLFNQAPGAAYDQLNVAAVAVIPRFVLASSNVARFFAATFNEPRFMKHPLDGAVEQNGVIEFADLTIKPDLYASDRRRRELAECRGQRRSGRSI